MGDEELNFTEEEARCWAEDPRNQAPKGIDLICLPIVLCLLFLAVIIIILVTNGAWAPHRAELAPLLVLRTLDLTDSAGTVRRNRR